MNQKIKKYANLALTFLMIGFIAIQIGPSFISNFSNEGKTLPRIVTKDIGSKTELALPLKGNSIIIFWATWCGPCKIEMNRLQESVDSGKIPAERIIAINAFEDEKAISAFLKSASYSFKFIANQSLAETLEISRTPTTLFVENGVITKMSSGLSLLGIWQAEFLFN